MKNIRVVTLAVVLFGMGIALDAYAQCKSDVENVGRPFYEVETECAKANSESSYLSDGKDYRALLTNNSSEFVVVFYADNKYRIAACTDVGGPLSFTVKDHKGNMLFTNKDYENAPYWDLVFPTTIECLVTITLPDETKALAFGEAAPASDEQVDSVAPEGEVDTESATTSKTEQKPVCAVLVIGYKQ